MPDEFIFDVDGANIKQAKELTFALLNLLEDAQISIPVQVYFSGEKAFMYIFQVLLSNGNRVVIYI